MGGEGVVQGQIACVHVPTLTGPGHGTMPESLLLCQFGRLVTG